MIYKPNPEGFRCPAEVIQQFFFAWEDSGVDVRMKMGHIVYRYDTTEHHTLSIRDFLLFMDDLAWWDEDRRCYFCGTDSNYIDQTMLWYDNRLICLECAKEAENAQV